MRQANGVSLHVLSTQSGRSDLKGADSLIAAVSVGGSVCTAQLRSLSHIALIVPPLAGGLSRIELLVAAQTGTARAVHLDARQNNFPTFSNVSTPSTAKIAAAMP